MSLAQSYDVIVIPRPLAVGLGLRAAAPDGNALNCFSWVTLRPSKASMSKQKQPRRLTDADVGMFGAESSPSRSATIALIVSSALCGPCRLAPGACRQ